MHPLILTVILIYVASKVRPRELLVLKLAIFFLLYLPLTILLWHVGATGVFADALWRITMAFGELYILFLRESYGWLIR